ncbi:tyrosine-type recombinase/integrase [Streptomyces roseoverticillatus]|uniref:tyrosine-type recombinase/integrase n=1 Tax=Streptomyces roseoverticillatus TaxID=66429 RepID=UPI001F2A486F|nr:tyrosine-type recombinase/integrase [Streptomyces roseoverticillatus]MCF3101495.1 tyrosine-type recombinase/integrase [Streptomyces roseoverticillatus]
MARRATNNPRQLPNKSCGCKRCKKEFPELERKDRRDCIGSWQARYRDAEGRQRGPVFASQKEAIAHLDKVRTQVREGTYLDPQRGAITVAQWYTKWWPAAETKAVTTTNRKLSTWKVHVEPKWGRRKLNSITWIQVQDWVTNDVKGRESKLKALELLRHIMAAAVHDRRIMANPTDGVKVVAATGKHPDDLIPPTHQQCNLIRLHLPEYYHPLVVFAEETGARWGEYTDTRACNLDLNAGTVKVREVLIDDGGHLRRKATPKSHAAYRTIPLTPAAVAAAQTMIDRWAPATTRSLVGEGDQLNKEELVFLGPRGAALYVQNFRRRWIEAIQAAGLARIVIDPETGRKDWWPRVHDLRHTFATRLKDAGVPEKDVQVIMGHERGARVTWLYQHAGPNLVEEVRSALTTGRHLRVVS